MKAELPLRSCRKRIGGARRQFDRTSAEVKAFPLLPTPQDTFELECLGRDRP